MTDELDKESIEISKLISNSIRTNQSYIVYEVLISD